jgi:hypothetical protein
MASITFLLALSKWSYILGIVGIIVLVIALDLKKRAQ